MGTSGEHRFNQNLLLSEEVVPSEIELSSENESIFSEDDQGSTSGVRNIQDDFNFSVNQRLSNQPLCIDPKEIFHSTGRELLNKRLVDQPSIIIESNGIQPSTNLLKFKGKDLVAYTSPGLPALDNQDNRHNSSAYVIHSSPNSDQLSLVMMNGLGSDRYDSALANAAALTVAYDLARPNPLDLPRIFRHANQIINEKKQELNLPARKIPIIGAHLSKLFPEDSSYQLSVFGAGDLHCLLINKKDNIVRYSPLQTVNSHLQNKKIPMGKRQQIITALANKHRVNISAAETAPLRFLGEPGENFQSTETTFIAHPGEILLITTSTVPKSLGGHEHFQDSSMGKNFAELYRQEKSLFAASARLIERHHYRQHRKITPDLSFSIIALEIPGLESVY